MPPPPPPPEPSQQWDCQPCGGTRPGVLTTAQFTCGKCGTVARFDPAYRH
jgi:hypothetical protein